MKSSPNLFTEKQVALLLGCFLFAAFPEVLIGAKTFFYRDFGVLAYPTLGYSHDSFWRGELPLWNPYSNCGAPFLAQWGTMVLYPGSLICLLLPLPWSGNFFCLLHLWFGAMGTFFLAQRWVENGFASVFAATAFLFNGITLACLAWPNYAVALGWMPWVVLAMERCCEKGGRALVYAALAGAMQMLSGVPEIVILTWGLICLDAVFGPKAKGQHFLTPLTRIVSVALIVAALAAAQLIPFFQLLSHSQRQFGSSELKWSLPAWGWANFIIPLFRAFKTPEGTFFQFGQEFFSSTYLGLATAALALLGTFERGRARLLALLALGLAVLALGSNGFLYDWVKSAIPFVGIARYPVKFLLLFPLLIPMLAAFGLRTALDNKKTPVLAPVLGAFVLFMVVALWFMKAYPLRYDWWNLTVQNSITRIVLGFGIIAGVGLFQRFPERRLLAAVAVLALIALDGRSHLPNQNPSLRASILEPGAWKASQKIPQPSFGTGRIFITPPAEERLLRSSIPNFESDFVGKRMAQWSHLNLLERIPKVNGSSTLRIRDQDQIETLFYKSNFVSSPFLDFLNVTSQTSSNSVVEWEARPTALPLISSPEHIRVIEGKNTLTNLAELDPSQSVLLDREEFPLDVPIINSAARLSAQTFSPHEITFKATAEGMAAVVIAQSWFANWKAEVDGADTPLLHANHAFQAIILPPGSHSVRIFYRDIGFKAGCAVSGLAFLGCAFYWFLEKRTPRQKE